MYSLLNLVLLLLVVLVGWPRDIVLARTLLAAHRWLFIAAVVVIVVAVVVVGVKTGGSRVGGPELCI